ncbi:hypothetical protein D3C78_353630 [compost metagenome]
MAGLAADIQLGPARGEGIALRIVALAQRGRVAVGAHEVPVLRRPGPVQLVAVIHLLIGIEVEPALPAGTGRAAVPGDGKGLQAAVGKFHQVLLQRLDAEGVADLELGELPVGTVGAHEEAPVAAKEARLDPCVVKGGVVEVAEHRVARRVLHGVGVLRALPGLELLTMAVRTGLAADMHRLERAGLGGQQRLLPAEQPDQQRQREREQEPARQRAAGDRRA